MFVCINFDNKDETRMFDILQPQTRDFKLYVNGTTELCAAMFEVKCNNCNNQIQMSGSEDNKEKLVIFSLKNKAETMELLCELTSTGLTKVQTAVNIQNFFELRKVNCGTCENRQMVATTTKVVQNTHEEQLNIMEEHASSESDVEEEFRTIDDSVEVETSECLENQEQPMTVPVPPPRNWKPETRNGRSFVENQERTYVPRKLSAEGSQTDSEKENRSPNKLNISQHNAGGSNVPKGERTCNECSKVLKVALGPDFHTNMTYSINSHSRTHVGKNPFGCEICDYKCRFANLMKKHFKNHHDNQKPIYYDISNDVNYIEEVREKAKQCFPDWVPVYSRNSTGTAIKRPHEE